MQTKIAGQSGTIAGFPRGADVLEAGALLNEAWTQAGKPTAIDFRKQADGCTMSPDGWWGSSCNSHDACYDSCSGRSSCDSQFYSCMDAMTGGPLTLRRHRRARGQRPRDRLHRRRGVVISATDAWKKSSP